MNTNPKRERIKAVVLEQEKLRTDIERLTARSAELDAELDRLLSATSAPARKAATGGGAAAATERVRTPTSAKKKPVRRRRRKAAKSTTPAQKTPTRKAKVKKAPPVTQTDGPTLKEKILMALREKPDGLDLGVIAKHAYGSDDNDARRKCEQNLYNMAKQKLVQHDGPKWQIVPTK